MDYLYIYCWAGKRVS